MGTRASALAEALAPVGGGRVLWIDVDPIVELDSARGSIRAASGEARETGLDAVVTGSLAEPSAAAREARACVREGGVIAMIVPIEREGMRAAAQRAALVFDRRARVRALEDACAALLSVGVSRIEVIEIDGARGEVVVHGAVAARR